jgi:hypothetical protein
MDVNVDAGILTPRGVLGFFASKLAPTANGSPRFQGRNRQYAPSGFTPKKTKQ